MADNDHWIDEELEVVARLRDIPDDSLIPSPPPPAGAAEEGEDAPASSPSSPAKRKRRHGRPAKREDVVARESRDLAKIRDQMILAAHFVGVSQKDLATKYGLTVHQVKEAISEAQRSQAFRAVRDALFFNLLPLALANIEEALKQGNLEASFRVTDAAKVTGSQSLPWGQTAEERDRVDSFEAFRWKVTRGAAASPPAIEGEVVASGFADPGES